MSDIRRKIADATCGKGGVHCTCCNDFKQSKSHNHGTKRARTIFRGIVRAKLKNFFKRNVDKDSLDDQRLQEDA